jgi:hypothetical protein
MPADPVRAAIYKRLDSDATLAALLSGPHEIHEEKAPAGTEPPYVIFQHQVGTEQWVFGEGNERAIWLVRGVCRGATSTRAEEIDARCRELLHRTKLAVPGGNLTILRESGVSYGDDDAEHWYHRGGLYRVFTP